MIDIQTLTEEQFSALPLVIEGESKEVRYAGKGFVVIRFKPTIYSFTSNRTGIVPGSDTLRLEASKIFIEFLQRSGITHAYREITDKWVLADLLLQPATLANPHPFRPEDMDPKICSVAPPIEVVVKSMHSGTSKHRYYEMAGHPVRESHPLYGGAEFTADDAYPETFVRFDWRNPFQDSNGKQLADEVLGDQMADWFINVSAARSTALRVYDALSSFLDGHDIVCYDLCLFIDEAGTKVFGEISQDCGRFRHYDLGSLDKDVWRAGGSSEMVLEKWKTLLTLIQGEKK